MRGGGGGSSPWAGGEGEEAPLHELVGKGRRLLSMSWWGRGGGSSP